MIAAVLASMVMSLSLLRPAQAVAPCTASGAFVAASNAEWWDWDLHDRGGEISGNLWFYGWVPDLDVEPWVVQKAAVAGHRKGDVVVLTVADPRHGIPVRKVWAKLICFPPTKQDTGTGYLVFPMSDGMLRKQLFARVGSASVAREMISEQIERLRSTVAIDQKPFRERMHKSAKIRQYVAEERQWEEEATTRMLVSMALRFKNDVASGLSTPAFNRTSTK